MRLFIIFLFLIFLQFRGFTQSFVSTTPENKNVLLEQFTGYYAGFDPDGHVKADQVKANNPNDVFLVRIHTGGYSNPNSSSDPNFQSPFGAYIASISGLAGYPAGTINRRNFEYIGINPQGSSGTTALSRGDWQQAANEVLAELSDVNIGAQAFYDFSTGVLTVNTETYYTSTVTNVQTLNVAVLQNNLPGPQSGAQNYNPADIIPGPWSPTYNHRDVLRHLMEGQHGLEFNVTTAGTFIPNTHTWNVPNDLSSSGLSGGYFPYIDPINLEVIAFITEGNQQNVYTAFEAPVIPVFSNAYDVNLINIIADDVLCASQNDINIIFRNYGSVTLNSCVFNYSINGTSYVYNWFGNLSAGAEDTITLSNVLFTPQSSNTVNCTASNPNWQTDQNLTNNTLSTNFTHQNQSGNVIGPIQPGNISIDISTDNWGGETTWEVVAEDGSILGSGGPYSSNTTIPTEYVSVPASQCFEFILYDSYGDGMCCSYGIGSVLVQDANGLIIFNPSSAELTNFTELSSYFSSGTPIYGCTNPNALNYNPLASADDGSCILPILGCTDSLAGNYNPLATNDDGSCIYCDINTTISSSAPSSLSSCDGFLLANSTSSFPILTYLWQNSQGVVVGANNFIVNLCADAYILIVNDSLGCSTNDTVILGNVYGCTDPSAFNYSWTSNVDDGSCIPTTYGCTNPIALNFDSTANIDDGSCCFANTSQIGQDLVYQHSYDDFGKSVSLSSDGNTVAIGSKRANTHNGNLHGKVQLFTKITDPNSLITTWTQVGQDIIGQDNDGLFGHSVSLSGDGNTVAIGAPNADSHTPFSSNYLTGHVKLFTKISDPVSGFDTWTQIGQDIEGESSFDQNGQSVSLSGDGNTVAIGTMSANYVRLFTKISDPVSGFDTWTQIGQNIEGESGNDWSGRSLSLSGDGNTVAIGAQFNNGNGNHSGHVRLYTKISDPVSGFDSWTQTGQDIDGEAYNDQSGSSVSLSFDGNNVAIGAIYNDGNGNNSGHVRIFENNGTSWVQVGQDIDGEAAFDQSGYSVSLSGDGNIVAIGAPYNDVNGNNSGHVRLYTKITDPNFGTWTWTQLGSDINGYGAEDVSGTAISLSIDGSTLAVGAGSEFSSYGGGYVRIFNVGGNCSGCIDPLALNYDSTMQYDDGSCIYPSGCTDSLAYNFVPGANVDDGSCLYCDLTNTFFINNNTPGNCNGFIIANSSSSNLPISYLWSTGSTQNNLVGLCSGIYSVIITDNVGCSIEDSIFMGLISGCTDTNALNFDPNATVDDGSCIYCVYGCMDPTALNYDVNATCDDGSCAYSSNCTSPKPTGLYAYDVIDTRAKIGWNNMNDPNCMVWKYFVRYREVGTSQWTTKSAGVGNGLCNFGLNTVTKQLLNLTPSTTYEFRMKAFYCGGTSSNYSPPVQFTTADVCPDMTNLTTTTFNGNQAKVRFNWDTTGAYTFARILLRVDTAGANWQTAGGFGIYYPQLFVNKFGLTPGQSYRAQGRTFCDSNITAYRSPTWTSPIFWTQPGSIREGGGLSINNLDIYPNPSRDLFNITFSSEKQQDLHIRILSVVGAEVYSEDRENFIGEYTKQVSLDRYGKGIYFLEIETNNGIVNKKLILQ